jgi:dethiobiotin synthetase
MFTLRHAKRSYVTRNVQLNDAVGISSLPPELGDLVLARVDRIRQHGRLENPEGRRVHLFTGDEIILATGNRYATGQFHAQAPDSIGKCHLVAAGGIAANMLSRSSHIKPATEITLLGTLVSDSGRALNLQGYKQLKESFIHPTVDSIPVLVVLGSDMNSGKTSIASAVINGFRAAGMKVAGAKLTGTGSGPDYWKMLDAGAFQVRDFLDAGYSSTAGMSEANLINILRTIKADAYHNKADVLVVEVADGVLQPENQALLAAGNLTKEVSGALIAADSSSAAVLSCERVIQSGIPVLGLGGVFSRSELCNTEVAHHLGLPIFQLDDLRNTEVAHYLLNTLNRGFSHAAISAV